MSGSPLTAEDLTLYAMGLLDNDEAARVELLLSTSAAARGELAEVRGDLALVAISTELSAPSAGARQRLLSQIAREPRTAQQAQAADNVSAQSEPAAVSQQGGQVLRLATPRVPLASGGPVRDPRPVRGIFSTVLPWAGWAIAATLAVAAVDLYRETTSLRDRITAQTATARQATARAAQAQLVLDTLRSDNARHFLLTRTDAVPVMQARVTYLAEKGSIVLQASNLAPAPPSKAYELWLIPSEPGSSPIAAGTFKPDARGFASLLLPSIPKGIAAGKFGVTLEDEAGASAPTSPILMAGE